MFGFFACQKNTPPGVYVKGPDFEKGESLLYKNNDSAYYYFNKVITTGKDSLKIAMAYNYMGLIQSDAGDYFGAQESLLTSLKFLDEKKENNINCISSDYNELGINSVSLKNYDAAIAYYDSAFRIAKEGNLQLVILNNKALVYQKKGAYAQALKLYKEIIPAKKNKKEYARILSNIAKTKWLQNPGYNAAPELLGALQIRRKENDLWGQNASYAHLADYYSRKDADLAFLYAREMYAVAGRLQSPDDRLEALQKIVRSGPAKTVKAYFAGYQQLSDSLQTARNAAKNQFALIRYDAEKNKADNLKLQKDNTEKRYEILRQGIFLYATLFVLVGGAIAAFFWYRKRKQRLELEAQNAIRESQLKTSKTIHDVVANGLYRMMSEVENQEQLDRDLLLDRIEILYDRSREISYEITNPYDDRDFSEKIAKLIFSFAAANTKVLLLGNEEAFWTKTNTTARYEIEHILQELMVNMRKHSQAENVLLKFEQQANQLHILYTDDGTGFVENVRHKNGLTNTGNRIKTIGGTIIFDSNADKGLRIQLSFPVVA
jgi:tetratricopeptide (TPR) repeat protein